ncbi:hypothetical protein KIPB_010476 [Kipferlia bialata]|uniref:Uncharacterized protein n=1 Tax=Kipferlia bialata TaxID=797122 RepID=A0A391NYM0_9EUKA|nr:hypothetical protein KIPB_010476 [Kipferlia bialata]|eukprot:g10476.t1
MNIQSQGSGSVDTEAYTQEPGSVSASITPTPERERDDAFEQGSDTPTLGKGDTPPAVVLYTVHSSGEIVSVDYHPMVSQIDTLVEVW